MESSLSLLHSTRPAVIALASPEIAHDQLRDSLLICPRESGVLNYVVDNGIMEQDISSPGAQMRMLCNLTFTPTSLTSLQVGNGTLIAAGGRQAEVHVSYHTTLGPSAEDRKSHKEWEFMFQEPKNTMNNSVLLTSFDLTRSHQSIVDPRLLVSDNEGVIKLYDISLSNTNNQVPHEVGCLMTNDRVNHSSISPDGRTLIWVGDTHDICLYQIAGGAQVSFQPITTIEMPSSPTPTYLSSFSKLSYPVFSRSSCPIYSPRAYHHIGQWSSAWHYRTGEACFSTAFSADGTKFAVASEQGAVAVWDIRSTKPLKEFHTSKMRSMGTAGRPEGSDAASGWLSDPWGWTTGIKRPGWSVRSVKFTASGQREIMAFTEHTSVIHVVDAQTFEMHETIRMPTLQRQPAVPTSAPKYFEDLDITGMCFDPRGEKLYAAGQGIGVAPVHESTGFHGDQVLYFGAVAEWDIRTNK